MGKLPWQSEWLRQCAVVVGYATAYGIVHQFTDAHLALAAALRVTVLLLLPFRFWPALVVGEAIPNTLEALACLNSFGWTWAGIKLVPEVLVAMPVVGWARTRLGLFPTRHLVDINALLICLLIVSVAFTAYSYAAVSVVRMAGFTAVPLMAVGYFIGNYLAIMAVVPWALMARLDYRGGELRAQFRQIVTSRLLIDGAAVMVPALFLLGWIAHTQQQGVKQVALMAMFLPVAWLTLINGWRAAVLGGTLAILCSALMLPSKPDPMVLEIQTFIAITITLMYGLGARISAQQREDQQERLAVRTVQRLARKELQRSEHRMRQTSQVLDQAAEVMQFTNSRIFDQMRRFTPQIEQHAYYRQAVATQHQLKRLAESMHPSAWRERGLPAAMQETIARALDEAGISYHCEIKGRGFSRLTPTVLSATYRAACEQVVLISERLTCTRIHLVLRGGETHGTRWVVIRVEGHCDDAGVARAVYHSEKRQRIATLLGAMNMSVDDLREHAKLFDGELHQRGSRDQLRISVLLHDSNTKAREHHRAPAPLRLWVQ
jgi:two-component system, NarL family, sensor histidine kinase FusK